MAKLIDNVEVKLGRAIRVHNTEIKHRLEATYYYALQVEDQNSKNERCLLFTEKELEGCPVVDFGLCDTMIAGRLYPYSDNQSEGYLIKTLAYSANRKEWYIIVRRITKRKIELAEKRANNNPEDLTKKSWLVDFLD